MRRTQSAQMMLMTIITSACPWAMTGKSPFPRHNRVDDNADDDDTATAQTFMRHDHRGHTSIHTHAQPKRPRGRLNTGGCLYDGDNNDNDIDVDDVDGCDRATHNACSTRKLGATATLDALTTIAERNKTSKTHETHSQAPSTSHTTAEVLKNQHPYGTIRSIAREMVYYNTVSIYSL